MNLKNSLYKVTPRPFTAEIEVPYSKSHANRALIIGALKGNGFTVFNAPHSSDVTTMIDCLIKVGLNIEKQDHSYVFHNSFPACEKDIIDDNVELFSGDGGTTNRFLLALLSRGKKRYHFFPSEKMSERPIDDLLGPLSQLKVKIDHGVNGAWISIQGPATFNEGDSLKVDCSKSTQFASALMLAFSNSTLEIVPVNVVASETYLQMTRAILKGSLKSNSYWVAPDFSGLSYPLALAAVSGKVLVKNVFATDSLQADSLFLDILKQGGSDLAFSEQGLVLSNQKELSPFDIDGSHCPDLVPTLAFLASQIKGKSFLRRLSILRHKESDRLTAIIELLKKFNVSFHFDEDRDEISITGPTEKVGPLRIVPPRDHRMVMVSYLFLRVNEGGDLMNTDCVDKSFPGFFKSMGD